MATTVTAAQPSRAFAEDLAERRNVVVPQFDPASAGIESRVLLLFEAPGPMSVGGEQKGSGFISVDNNDQSAESCRRARDAAGLHEYTLGRNIFSWHLDPASKKPSPTELAQGAMELRRLLPLFPALRVVVLCGPYAQKGWHKHVEPMISDGPIVLDTWHPSPLGFTHAGHREAFTDALRKAAAYL